MIIRLQTRCGCVRLVDVDRHRLNDTYEVALLDDIMIGRDDKLFSNVKMIKRTFRYRGEDYDGIPIFLEVL